MHLGEAESLSADVQLANVIPRGEGGPYGPLGVILVRDRNRCRIGDITLALQ
jgi:hypothetical protein